MIDESAEILDDILSRWHTWRQGYRPTRGFNDRSTVAGENYLVSRQYDDTNGALDDALESRTMRNVDHEISELGVMQQIVLAFQARSLSLGCEIWTNPRLPTDPAERDKLLGSARAALSRRLANAGVI